jgi:AcrR family transcriptional regulator
MSTQNVSPRDRIMKTIGPLFYREGYRAIGVDRIIAESGVAKATFYKHFPAKDDVIVAWLDAAESMMTKHLPDLDVQQPLFAYADHLIEVAKSPSCLGCTFQVAAAEFGDATHPAHARALQIKERVIAQLVDCAAAQGVEHPKATANNLYLFLEGIWASVRMWHAEAPLDDAKAAIRKLCA